MIATGVMLRFSPSFLPLCSKSRVPSTQYRVPNAKPDIATHSWPILDSVLCTVYLVLGTCWCPVDCDPFNAPLHSVLGSRLRSSETSCRQRCFRRLSRVQIRLLQDAGNFGDGTPQFTDSLVLSQLRLEKHLLRLQDGGVVILLAAAGFIARLDQIQRFAGFLDDGVAIPVGLLPGCLIALVGNGQPFGQAQLQPVLLGAGAKHVGLGGVNVA